MNFIVNKQKNEDKNKYQSINQSICLPFRTKHVMNDMNHELRQKSRVVLRSVEDKAR